MTDSSPQPLSRDRSDPRIRGLRERLLRAGFLSPSSAPAAAQALEFDLELENAVRAFQQSRGLIVDGVVGPETERRLSEAQYTLGDRPLQWNPDQPLRGDDVERLQQNLSLLGLYYGHLNGAFQENTHLAVLELQQSLGLERTGRVDLRTIEALARINKNITDSKAFSLRDFHNLESANGAIRQRDVVLVPSRMMDHHPRPSQAPADFEAQSERICLDIALRAHELLGDVGGVPHLVADTPVRASDGTSVASSASLEEALEGLRRPVVVVIGCDWNPVEAASGVAAYYWGAPEPQHPLSPIAHRGASLIHREMVARTGAMDLGCHGREWTILRTTPAPTIALDIGYLSNPAQARDLAHPDSRGHLAQSIVVGLQRMYLQSAEDLPTGSMSAQAIAREIERRPRV